MSQIAECTRNRHCNNKSFRPSKHQALRNLGIQWLQVCLSYQQVSNPRKMNQALHFQFL